MPRQRSALGSGAVRTPLREPHIGFVHESRAFQSVTGIFSLKITVHQAAQFRIDERPECLFVAVLPFHQQPADRFG